MLFRSVWEDDFDAKLFPIWVKCERARGPTLLPVHKNARTQLLELHRLTKRAIDRTPEGPVFRILRHPFTRWGDREARDVMYRAIARVGLRDVKLFDMRAALADHLVTMHSITEIELTDLFGYSVHEHARRLLKSHRAWRLNQMVGTPEP